MKIKIIILILTVISFTNSCTTISLLSWSDIPEPAKTSQSFDPNLLAVQNQLTADSAQGQAEIYAIMATGTAQAPIINITSSAAAFSQGLTQISVDKTSIAESWTATPSPIPTVTLTATPNATQTLIFAQSAADVKNIQLETERAERTNTMRAIAGYAVLFIVSIVGVLFAFVYLKRLSFSHPGVDDFGKPLPILNYIDAVVTDLDKATNGTVGITQKFLTQLPQITAERQDRVTLSSHLLDMNTRRAVPKRLSESHAGLLEAPVEEEQVTDMQAADLLLPEWDIINGWDGKSRPLGLGKQGIIVAQAASPHLLTTGGTGSGKTAFMLRTQATASLAKGYQVINLGFSDSGFGVFSNHPNFHSIKLNQSSDVIDCLTSVYKELKQRKEIIGGESIEWDHWRAGEIPPRPFVDVLIDELGNLSDDIYESEETSREGAVRTAQLWRLMSMIAKEGRKVGIRFLAALQDPTAKGVNLSFRRNCTLVSFQLGDASQSRSFIGVAGAELLRVGHFMTRNFTGAEGVIIGGGFAPTDEEILKYLKMHPVSETPEPKWIDGVIVKPALPMREPVKQLDSITVQSAPTLSRVEFVNGLSEWETQALSLYEDGLEEYYIVQKVFAGDDLRVGTAAVADLVKRWKDVKRADSGAKDTQAEIDRIELERAAEAARLEMERESKIRLLHAQGKNKTAIVYEVWDKSGAEFSSRMEIVKRVLAETSTSQVTSEREMPGISPLPA